jgi:hypothetical protein
MDNLRKLATYGIQDEEKLPKNHTSQYALGNAMGKQTQIT